MSDRETRDFEPQEGDFVMIGASIRHFKGSTYRVYEIARHTDFETMDKNSLLVIYGSPDKYRRDHYARPLAEFYQEVKDDDGCWVRRFTLVNPN